MNPDTAAATLRAAGFIAAEEEAQELFECALGDAHVLAALLTRRLNGEPLAWITGTTIFCDHPIRVHTGVYVPRWQSEPLARRALDYISDDGIAIDLCTGSGAIARVLKLSRPASRVIATELDPRAVACARANDVEVYQGDLFAPVPTEIRGRCDVVVGVVPYVPTPNLRFLARDTFDFESTLSYDGGPDGTTILRRVLEQAPRFLRPGGVVLLELGGEEANELGTDLARHGFELIDILLDDEDGVRGIVARHVMCNV